jgi:hypothetical protein
MDIIESNIENISILGKVATVVIELSQNMMVYSKTKQLNCKEIFPSGFIEVSKKSNLFFINSKNIIDIDDKNRIEPKLLEIQSLDIAGIKKRYKELRKSGENAHDNNGGIGFYEITKLLSNFEFEFIPLNEQKYYFIFKAEIEQKVR